MPTNMRFPHTFFLKNKPYVVERKLGEGGFSIAYLVKNAEGKYRVIKDMKVRQENACASAQDSACMEGNIVRHLYLGNDYQGSDSVSPARNNRTLIKMKYVKGCNYTDRLNTPISEKPKLIKEVLEAAFSASIQQVIYYHGMGVRHNDVKPDNLRLTFLDGLTKVSHIDFGLSSINERTKKSQGTLPYVFIQLVGIREVPRYSDVFALAISLKLHLAGMTENQLIRGLEREYFKIYGLEVTYLYDLCLHTSHRIANIIQLPENASNEEQAIANFLDEVINGKTSKVETPKAFLEGLLGIYNNPDYHFPKVCYVARAEELIKQSDLNIFNDFTNGNKEIKKLSAKIKAEIANNSPKKNEFRQLLRQIQNTSPFDRTIEFAQVLDKKYQQIFEQSHFEKVIKTGVLKYKEFLYTLHHSPTTSNLRDEKPLGIFTQFRHGKKGDRRADRLLNKISQCNSDEAIWEELRTFFTKSNRRYHKHSLSSFILDELIQMDQQSFVNIELDQETKKYNPESVKATFKAYC